MLLFHVSEESDIEVFKPRPPPSPKSGVIGNAVWALDADHLPHYLFPRDCPRVTLRVTEHTTASDRLRLFGSLSSLRSIAVESGWAQRIRDCRLFVYEFSPAGFELCDATAGYYICRQAVLPVAKREIKDPIAAILERGIELRFFPNLWPLRDEAIASTAAFSIIRMRNALSRDDI
jgi:hypothetical protein